MKDWLSIVGEVLFLLAGLASIVFLVVAAGR